MIGVARPTRGLEFAESAQSIERSLAGQIFVTERSWDRPIPDSFNYVTRLLLAYSAVSHLWFVEEDVVVSELVLMYLLALGTDIAAVRYPLKVDGRISEERSPEGEILWESLGCTLIRREVFEVLPEPWFKTGYTLLSIHEGSSCQQKTYRLALGGADYGNHDMYFCWTAKQAGFTIGVVETELADHLILDGLGKPQVNNGCHRIRRARLCLGGCSEV